MKSVVKSNISFQDYKDCLFFGKPQMRKINIIKSHLHEIISEEINEVALYRSDDKKIILENGINTLAYDHFKTLSAGNSEFSKTTCNSYLTNPRLGAPSDI